MKAPFEDDFEHAERPTGLSAGGTPEAGAVPPPDATELDPPFGWATLVAAEPSVTKVGSIYNMYFVGQSLGKGGFGLATSTDGLTYTPLTDPVLQSPVSDLIYSPSVFANGTLMAYALGANIALASSTNGSAFSTASPSVLGTSQCSYCTKQVTFPQVLPDALADVPDGGAPPYLMFFSAIRADGAVSIGRASSPDGMSWQAEPAPILSGDLSGEAVLLSPRVLIDGTVYKMWYSFARKIDVKLCIGTGQGTCPATFSCVAGVCAPTDTLDAFSTFCEAGTTISIGYATSNDGFFWVKSIYNPVLDVDVVGGGVRALLASSVLPTDGVSAENGVTLYYSSFRRLSAINNRCLPNGIKRATRQ